MRQNNLLPRGVSLIALLLCVMSMSAQTYLQYWFDTDTKAKKLDLPASGSLTTQIDVKDLSQGLHTLYLRARHPGAEYEWSPITTSTFIKVAVIEGSVLEYWFDDDVDNRSKIDVDVKSGEKQILALDVSNLEHFPLGVHQLNMRVNNSGHYSPVYSDYVLRVPNGTGDSVLEYWFDDDFENRATMPVKVSNGLVQKLNLDLSNTAKFPYGYHRLKMRIAAAGSRYSPVYSAVVMRQRKGEKPDITYWIDDDYDHRQVWKTRQNGQEYHELLKVSSASEGMHRLHMRINNNGVDDGPVYETPFLYSMRFNSLVISPVVEESTWVDDAVPFNKDVNAQHIYYYTGTYILNPEQLSEGQHAFHVQYKNTFDMWSAQNVTYFYKDASGKLRAGLLIPEDDVTALNESAGAEHFACYYRSGAIVVDCQSSKLAATGVVVVCDLTGRVVAREEVTCADGLHAELNVNSTGRQMLIVKVLSGDVHFTKKMVVK